MRLSTTLDYTQDVLALVDRVRAMEAAGLDAVWVQEGYSYDAVSAVAFLAARTDRLQVGTAILNVFSRTPALLAMTAAGLDHLSGGRFALGLGSSGPQVVEGFHGVPFDRPLTRVRETVDICRAVWRREPLQHHGAVFDVPLPAGVGTGLGKPLKLVNPVQRQVPVYLAALGPASVRAAAEIADGWLPFFWVPERAADVHGSVLAGGRAARSPELGSLDVVAPVEVAVGDDLPASTWDHARARIALYVGGMGSRSANFYADNARAMGWSAEADAIQEHFLAGRVQEARSAVPEEWLRQGNLIGTEAEVAQRLRAFAESGVTTLDLTVVAGHDPASTVAAIRRLLG